MKNQGEIVGISAKRLMLALAGAGIIGGGVGAIAMNHNNAAASGAAAPAGVAAAAAPNAAATAPVGVALPDFTQIAARMGPAVVNIRVTGSTRTSYGGNNERVQRGGDPFGDDP